MSILNIRGRIALGTCPVQSLFDFLDDKIFDIGFEIFYVGYVFATIGFETFCFSAKLFYIPVELYHYLSYQFSFQSTCLNSQTPSLHEGVATYSADGTGLPASHIGGAQKGGVSDPVSAWVLDDRMGVRQTAARDHGINILLVADIHVMVNLGLRAVPSLQRGPKSRRGHSREGASPSVAHACG